MIETREQMLGRKQDVLAALRALERDRTDGSIDEKAYEIARRRYELEAATLLERLDTLESEPRPSTRLYRYRPFTVVGVAAGLLIVIAMAIFLVTALRDRGGGTITGDSPPAVATPATAASPQLVAAQQRARSHPASVDALLALGNAYLSANAPRSADNAFRRAIRLAPSRPEASTMHALIEGETSSVPQALALLKRVEAAHPRYAHAWLVDGLLASRSPSGYPRAILAYRRFIALEPNSPVTAEVLRLVTGLQRAERRKH